MVSMYPSQKSFGLQSQLLGTQPWFLLCMCLAGKNIAWPRFKLSLFSELGLNNGERESPNFLSTLAFTASLGPLPHLTEHTSLDKAEHAAKGASSCVSRAPRQANKKPWKMQTQPENDPPAQNFEPFFSQACFGPSELGSSACTGKL